MLLKESEQRKYNVIEELVSNKITRKEAGCKLNLSLKQIDRCYNSQP